MSENEFDYEGYEKSLERSLALAEKDYWSQYLDVNRHQVNVAKTYLWVAVAMLGAYGAILNKFPQYLLQNFCVTSFALISVLLVILAFGICLYAIPARQGYKGIPEISWGEFPAHANQLLTKKDKRIYISVLTDLNNKVDKSNWHNIATNQKRASLLRKTSWILIASFLFAVLTGVAYVIPISSENSTSNMEKIMPEDNEPQGQSQNQTPETVPDVPTPAGPITGGNPDMSTHTAKIPSHGNIRITESDESSTSKD
jgi:hypothetical protein